MKKRTKLSKLANRPWILVKDITVEAMLKSGVNKTCEDFQEFCTDLLCNGKTRIDALPLTYVLSKFGNTEIRWLQRHGFIKEDKTAFFRKVMGLIQTRWNDKGEYYKTDVPSVGMRSSQTRALIDFLIDINVIKEDDVSRYFDKGDDDDDDDEAE